MSVRSRSTLSLALALGVTVAAQPLHAQATSLVPSPVSSAALASAPATPAPTPAASSTPAAGPTLDAATVAVRHQADAEVAAPARRGGSSQAVTLMIVGGVALLVGLAINNSAGGAIAVGGAVVGLIGLYQYLQ